MNFVYVDYSIATRSLDIFVSGCLKPLCEDCFNMELADFNCGTYWMNWIDKINDYINNYNGLIDNIFLLGGSFQHQDSYQLKMFFDLIDFKGKSIYLFAREQIDKIQPIFKEKCEFIKVGEYNPKLICDNNIVYNIKLSTSNQTILKRGVGY